MNLKLPFIALLILISNLVSGQIFDPVKWTHELKITGNTTGEIIHKATIDDNWHLYGMKLPPGGPRPTTFVYEKMENVRKSGDIIPKSTLLNVFDRNFGMNLSWYSKEAIFVQKISFTDASKIRIEGYVEFMACDDERCLPPATDEFVILGSVAAMQTSTTTQSETVNAALATASEDLETADKSAELSATATDFWRPVIDELRAFGNPIGATDSNASLWLIFLAGLVGGFLALLTPCVWPIIPITVSFFLKRSENKTKGRRDAIIYGLSIIFIYVTLGILITLIFGASALNSMATNAVFNIFFFLLLVVFAISFFGAFEISLPASWSNKIDSKAENTAGVLSIVFMAFTLVLVSFSCTGPIIGTLLVEVAGSGTIIGPAIGMLGFAVALAIPFTFFAFFPALLKSLPKSGGWLNKVKVGLAFLVLALSFKFLSVADLAYGWRILDREVFLSIWIVIFTLLGFYLLGKIRFPHDSEAKHTSVPGTFLAIISLSFALYMVPGLWGAPLKAISSFTPPLSTQDFNLNQNKVQIDFKDFDEGMQYAELMNKPVVVDFSGHGCVNCRKMEATVWTHPRVMELLNNKYVLITLYVDDKTPLNMPFDIEENGRIRRIRTLGDKWSYLQRVKFGANAQPYYVMLNPQGIPINSSFTFDENPENFIQWLERE